MGDSTKEIICDIMCTMAFCLKDHVDNGLESLDSDDAGKVADIIKDLAQAKYYISVTDAMEDKEDDRYYTPRMRGTVRYGYRPMVDEEPYIDGYLHDPDFKKNMMNSEYGDTYTRYMDAKRHYTLTKDVTDKGRMDTAAKNHLQSAMDTIEDIWDDASPELKQKMKTDVKRLMDSMT